MHRSARQCLNHRHWLRTFPIPCSPVLSKSCSAIVHSIIKDKEDQQMHSACQTSYTISRINVENYLEMFKFCQAASTCCTKTQRRENHVPPGSRRAVIYLSGSRGCHRECCEQADLREQWTFSKSRCMGARANADVFPAPSDHQRARQGDQRKRLPRNSFERAAA
jgi:hypothetical protein